MTSHYHLNSTRESWCCSKGSSASNAPFTAPGPCKTGRGAWGISGGGREYPGGNWGEVGEERVKRVLLPLPSLHDRAGGDYPWQLLLLSTCQLLTDSLPLSLAKDREGCQSSGSPNYGGTQGAALQLHLDGELTFEASV